ncbi:MAG: Long-chain-fatty-acid--CoA ligase [Pelotomaculum sp. PtaU1.Bin035]|nr:MAG: Long-chain-fatty-acid--CoA ligase [Pelotomaculum sp. PtaU1.Bin035]
MNSFTYNTNTFRELFENDFTYLNGFLRNVSRFPQKTALTCPIRKENWTYRQLDGECNRLAHALLADEIKKGDVVVYQLLNSAKFVFCYLAPQKIGAINCPVNFRLSPGETAYILDESKPAVYIFDEEIKDMAEKALNIARHSPRRVVMAEFRGNEKPFAGSITYDGYVTGRPESDPGIKRPTSIYDETTRLYTSGTTGMPKGVPLNNLNEIFTAHDVIMHFPLNQTDKTMNMSPWFHRGGLHSGGPCPTLYAGGEIVALRQFNPRVCLAHVEDYGLTYLIGAPPMLKMLHDQQAKEPRDLKTIKGIITMGAPLEREACISFQKVLTPNIYNGYGTTEGFWNTFLRPFDLPRMAGSAGRPCTDDEAAVVKVYPDRKAEPDDYAARDNQEVGEIIIKSPAKCSYSYFNSPAEEERVFYKGWIYIGDLGVWNEENYITVVGRKDDMIICAGENIHPVQVEEILNEHPKVKESAVVGVPDKTRGEAVAAYVIKDDPSLTVKELVEHCRNHFMLANFKRPRFYRFVEALPYTATGKKIHYKVREMALEDKEKGLLERA